MPSSVAQRIKQTRAKIGRIRAALSEIEYLCSGTLQQRTKVCGRPTSASRVTMKTKARPV